MDEILSRTGWGLYSIALTGYGSLCYFSNALSYMNLPLYLPMISCDVPLSESAIAALDFCVYIGMAVGGFFLSAVSDVIGRKSVLAMSLLLIFLSVLLAAFAYGPVAFILAMLLLGTGLEANMNVIKILVIESIPHKNRNYILIFLDVFWVIGIMCSIGFYWLTAPILHEYDKQNQRYMNWRVSLLLSVLMSIFLACTTSLVLDSPKYLVFERRPRDALENLREMFAINKSKLFSNFQIGEGELHGKIMDFGISSERDIPNTISSRRFRIIFGRIHKSMLVLVRKQFLCHTLAAIFFRLILSLGHLPVIMFLTRTLDLEDNTLASDSYLLWHFEHPIFRDCDTYLEKHDIHLYRDFTILCTFSMSGYGILMLIVRFLERKFIMTSVLFLSGIFSLLLAVVVKHYIMRFAISSLFIVVYSMANSCLDLIILDLFPTAIRGTAMGETMIFARLANVFVIKYLTFPIHWMFIAFGCLLELGSILSLALPKFAKKPIVD